MKRRSFEQSDHIRLNLQWLDRHDGLHVSNIHRIFAEVPLLPLSIAMILGIIAAAHIPAKSVFIASLVFLPIPLGLLFLGFGRSSNKKKLYFTLLSAFILFACLGAARLAKVQYCPPDHIRHILQQDRQLATLRGTINSTIRISGTERNFSSIPWLSSQSSFYLDVKSIKTSSGWQTICGKVRVQVNDTIQGIQPGNDVLVYCRLNHFSPPVNPGQFDLQKHMNERGVFVAASVPTKDGIEVIQHNFSMLHRLRSGLYRFSADALLDETSTDEDVRSLVSALLLGRRVNLSPTIVSAFQKTNLAHFISLSGMHVGILAGSLWILLRTAQIPKRLRAILCIILILTYALIVPPRAPTMRAIFLSCFFFSSTLLHRRINPLNTLALSAMVLLFIRPYELFSAGWQLSFLSVFGILVFYKPVQYHILDRVFYPFALLLKKRFVWFQYILYGIVELISVGISAWIVIAPVLLYYFGQVNPLSALWTVLVFPAVLLILYTGFLKIAVSQLLPTLASLLGVLLNLLCHILEKMVLLLGKIDFLKIVSHRPNPVLIVTLYLLLAVACFLPFHYRQSRKIILSLLVICFLFPWFSRMSGLTADPVLELTCLSVGHGQAAVLSTPPGKHYLFDAGSITHQNIASKIVLPYLQHRRIFSLDNIYISHGDLDHLNALPEIAAMVDVNHVYGNSAFLENSQSPSLENDFKHRLAQLNLDIKPITHLQSNDMHIRPIWPVKNLDESLSENNLSEVFLIEYANRKILLCGDIENEAQAKFLDHYPDLKVDVMVLPHHGSTTNLDMDFIDKLKPNILIASCSRRNQPNAYHRPEHSDAACFYTSIDGAVTVKIKADGTLGAVGFLSSEK